MTEDDVLDFRSGKLEVHCRRIELTPRQTTESLPIVAPRRIYQQPDGTIWLTAYPETLPLSKHEPLPLGVSIPEELSWDLVTDDRSGRRWSSERLHLQLELAQWRPIEHQLNALHCEEHLGKPYKGSHFTGYIFRSLDIDPNANTERTMTRPDAWSKAHHANMLRFPVDDLQVSIRQEEDYTVIDVAADGSFPERFQQRLLEAVRFVFGRPLSWSATVHTLDTRRATYLRGRPVHDLATHVRQPIPHNVVGARDWMSELFRRYFLHVVRDPSPGWHPLSIWWSEVLRAGSREMESLVLIAAVAVEGVCNAIIDAGELPPGIQPISAEDSAAWHKKTAAALEKLDCPKRIRDRVGGVFPKMSQVGAGDVLFALQGIGAVDGELAQLWREARPHAAHGSGKRWSSADQITRDAYGLVSLLRQLTFWWIGYEGWYQHLAPEGWHMREYRR
jgi:hypothetical protein